MGCRDTDALREIMSKHPCPHLDEMHERLGCAMDKWWDASTIWRKITEELGVSLQIATIHAKQCDEEERDCFKESLKTLVKFVHRLTFLTRRTRTEKPHDAAAIGQHAASPHSRTRGSLRATRGNAL
jgi:hypothetical protein